MLRLALILACLPAMGSAFGGTQSTWLGGTLPSETVPYFEADPQILFSAGSGAPAAGLGLDLGLTDWWMLQGSWVKPLDGGLARGLALTRARLLPTMLGLNNALFAGAELPEGSSAKMVYGLVFTTEYDGHSLSVNQAFEGVPAMLGALSAAYWSPYVLYAVRLGLEGAWGGSAGRVQPWWMPQVAFNFPGDLSFDIGARIEADGSGDWRLQLRLSYELFPSP